MKGYYTAKVLKLNRVLPSGRRYSTACVKAALKDSILKEMLSTGTSFGEAFVGNFPYPWEHYHEIETTNIAIIIRKIFIRNGWLQIKYDTMQTPMGNAVEEAMKNGTKLEFYHRGWGNLEIKRNGSLSVTSFTLLTVDILIDPKESEDNNEE